MGIYRTVRKGLKFIDIFGAPIKFNIDGQLTYQSTMGGLTTLMMLALIIIFFQNQISNFFARKEIYVDQKLQFNSSPLPLKLDYTNFMFAIAVEQPTEYPFNQRPFFDVILKQNRYDRSQTLEQRDNFSIPLQPCTLERFMSFAKHTNQQNKIQNVYKKFQFSNYLCPSKDFSLNLSGAFLDTKFEFISLQIVQCNNDTINKSQNQTCAPQGVVNDFFKEKGSFRLNFYTTNYQINPEDSIDPEQLFVSEDLNFLFQPQMTEKKIDVFFNKYEVQTDNSLFVFPDIQNQKYILRGEDSFREQIVNKNQNSQSPLTIYLRSNYFSNYAKRQFKKIDQLLSYFGGIFNIFFLVFGLFMTTYNKNFMNFRLANRLYEFKEYKNKKRNQTNDEKVRNINAMIQSVQEKQNSQEQLDNEIQVDIHDGNKRMKEKAKLSDVTDLKKLKRLGFSGKQEFLLWYFESILSSRLKLSANLSYLIYKLSFKTIFATDKNKLLDKATTKIDKDMNIKNLMKNVTQIDKLKRLILTPEQIILFNFFPRQEISLDEEQNLFYTMENDDQKKIILPKRSKNYQSPSHNKKQRDFQDFQKLLEAFESLRTNNSNDETTQIINSKLIYLLGKELKSVFKACLLFQAEENLQKNIKLLGKSNKMILSSHEAQEQEIQDIRQTLLQSQAIKQLLQNEDEELAKVKQENQ